MRSLLTVVALLLSLPVSAAEAYWVLGSFTERAVAVAAGERISSEIGIEVLLQQVPAAERPQYRLLTGVMAEPSDQEMLRFQLQQAGIGAPWTLQVESGDAADLETIFADFSLDLEFSDSELAEIDALLGDLDAELADSPMLFDAPVASGTDAALQGASRIYVVAGSYASAAAAEARASVLRSTLDEVLVRSADVDDRLLHRVLVGPLAEGAVAATKTALAAMQIEGAWTLSEPAPVTPAPPEDEQRSLEIGRPLEGYRIPGGPEQTPRTGGPDVNQYHPARLRKSGGFPIPARN